MDATAVARSFPGAMVVAKSSGSFSKKLLLSSQFSQVAIGKKQLILPHLKATDTSSVVTSDVATAEKTEAVQKGTFPSGVEAMLRDICDGTSVAEVKLKVGNFEMYLKREVESSPVESHPPSHPVSVAPPVTGSSVSESAVPSLPEMDASPKSSTEERNPFENTSDRDAKLAFIQGIHANTYQVVSAPAVGAFLRSRTIKGKKRPSVCEEGSVIKEGQVIGFITQFKNDLPIRSNVAGEVIKFLCKDGEPVGYGDPLVAILPSFHGDEIGL